MQFMVASVLDFGVDCLHALFVLCSLSYRQPVFKSAIPSVVADLGAVAERGNVFQPQVDAYSRIRRGLKIFCFCRKTHEPMPLRVLDKTPSLEDFVKIPMSPEPVPAFLEGDGIAFELDSPADKRNPAERLSHAAEFRAFLMGIARLNKLFADLVAYVRVYAVLLAQIGSCFVQVEMAGPEVYASTLIFDAEVPSKVGFPLLLPERLVVVLGLDSEFVSQYHVVNTTEAGKEMQAQKSIRVTTETHKALKLLAAEKETSIAKLITMLLTNYTEDGASSPA